ncbi:MAG TPA: WecB/TagA/CpsF family glycosyltransferase [Thermoguttaceae bacterium]|nr:WecB/TagA/CpsF family glycosyltransferase [Thermoguttaceae bacterium]
MRETLVLPEEINPVSVPAHGEWTSPPMVRVWGLSLAQVTTDELVDLVDRLIERRMPSYFITANLHYAMLSARDSRLAKVNQRAAFLVADGMPLVWYSRLLGRPLPERVTGADSVYRLAERAAARGHRVFLLGARPEVARAAANRLSELYPGLTLAGVESPMLDSMSSEDQAALVERIRRTRPDLLLAALGQPKGELWLAENLETLGVPVCVQIGASLDFVAGRVRRAPRWMQRIGGEWFYRITREPRRMIPRYAADAAFMVRAMIADVFGVGRRRSAGT